MLRSTRRGRRRSLLPRTPIAHGVTLLGATHEAFNEVHVLCNDGLIDAMCLKVSEESNPRRVYTGRCEAFLRIIAHMGDVHERSRGRGGDTGFVDRTSFRHTLLLCGCCSLCIWFDFFAIVYLLIKVPRVTLNREDESNHAIIARKGVEERAVLIILKALVDLVLPNHTTIAHEIDKVKKMSTSGTVRDEQEGAL
jgi:hypothetical protein